MKTEVFHRFYAYLCSILFQSILVSFNWGLICENTLLIDGNDEWEECWCCWIPLNFLLFCSKIEIIGFKFRWIVVFEICYTLSVWTDWMKVDFNENRSSVKASTYCFVCNVQILKFYLPSGKCKIDYGFWIEISKIVNTL